DAVRTGDLVLQPKVNTQLQRSNRLCGIWDFTLEADVPASSCILGEAPGPDDALNRTRQPEAKPDAAVGDRIAVELDRGTLQWYPTKGTFPRTPLQFDFLKLFPACNIFFADCLNRLRRKMQVFRRTSRQCVQIIGRQKRLISAIGQQTDFLA